ncbi:uncharacterized protein [Polyergus mexicanus]|uniref:uncharacterized protein n=1 Tax=Polyergus mexicanus TaxID=615972 RepID=UPI0038B5CD7E
MRREYIFIGHLTWFFFLLHFESLYIKAEESGDEYSKGCAHLRCESGSQCIKRRFWCKDPPCPGMLYCSKSRKESLKGPLTCDTVRCNRGHVCIVKVGECHWDTGCKQQIARCISEKEYYEGAAFCAGFECPSGKRCILRETHCVNPPCKLIRSCAELADVQTWFDECRSLNCTSEYECFLRRSCFDSWCLHTPDCTLTVEDVLISKYCHGWICPQSQKCIVQIIGSCKGFDCTIERSCRTIMISSVQHDANDKVVEQPPIRKTLAQMESELIRQEQEKKMNLQTSYPITGEKSTLTTLMQRSSLHHTTSTKFETEISLTHQQAATTRNLITKSFESSTDQSDLTPPYSQSWWNYNKLSTNNSIEVLSNNATFSPSLPVEENIELTTSRDTKRLETPKKIYVASNDALPIPIVFEGINFVGQNYSIWIKDDPISSEIEDEDDDAWEPQGPYRILLPPYAPVTRERGQLFPFFSNAFDRSFNEATALIFLPEITFIGIHALNTTASKDNISTIVDNKFGKYINDPSSYYTNFPAKEKTNTIPPNIHEESDNHYDDYGQRLRFMIHDYLKRYESQSTHKQEFKSNVVDSAIDHSCKNNSDNEII